MDRGYRKDLSITQMIAEPAIIEGFFAHFCPPNGPFKKIIEFRRISDMC